MSPARRALGPKLRAPANRWKNLGSCALLLLLLLLLRAVCENFAYMKPCKFACNLLIFICR